MLTEFGSIKRRDKLDVIMTDQDLNKKMDLLTLASDTINSVLSKQIFFLNFKYIFFIGLIKFVPFSLQKFYFNFEFNLKIENIFYEFILARTENWQMGVFTQKIYVLIDYTLSLILDYY